MSTSEATQLLSRFPLVDGHNDLPFTLRERVSYDFDRLDIAERQPGLLTDIPRMREGRLGGQFWSVYVPSNLKRHEAVTGTLEQIDAVYRMVQRYPDAFEMAFSAEDVKRVFASGRIASLLGIEGGHAIENSLGALRMFYRLGVRYMTLTHYDDTAWSSSATDVGIEGGLSEFGHEVVREMNRIGMLVDLSHVSAETMRAALRTATAPVIFSHSNCRALVDHPRNVPDDVLKQLSANGGVIMLSFITYFVSEDCARWRRIHDAGERERIGKVRPEISALAAVDSESRPVARLSQVADHIEYARDVAGIDHIGIGSDFYDGSASMPEGLEDVSTYPALFAELMKRGWSEADLVKLAGGNILRALSDVERHAQRPTDRAKKVSQPTADVKPPPLSASR